MDWILQETNQLGAADVDRQGNKLLTGNGYIGYRGTLEEFDKQQKTATIVSGLYDRAGDQWREPVNLPNGGYVQVTCQGEALHALTGKVLTHTQGIDMASGVHFRETCFETRAGKLITITARRFASLTDPHLLCMAYTVRANEPCVVDIRSGIDGDVWDINGPHLFDLHTCTDEAILSLQAVTGEKQVPVAVAEAICLPGSAQTQVYTQSIQAVYRELPAVHVQDSYTFHKFVAHYTGIESADPAASSRQACQQAAAQGFEAALAQHQAVWAQRWAACDIRISGDDEAQQALRFSLYHLLSIVPAHTERASIPARGMSGQMYKGAIFWDTEVFMLPFFVHAFPELARNLLLYRYHTLDGARRKAREYGHRGAFYAWESQDSGDDACTLFNITDVFTNRPMRTYFRDKQIHISGDIAYAFWKYFTLTGDASIWQAGGAEVVFECARFYLSWLVYHPDRRRYEILDVTGPDEYHERVHNNAYTNRMVANTFEMCLKLAAYLAESAPDYFTAVKSTLQLESDLAFIPVVLSALYLPDSAPDGSLIPQFDGYFALENTSVQDLVARKLHPNEYFGGGNGLATTTQILKQADVVLMLALFGEHYSLATKQANWEYYEPRTEHGSSLSACSYSLVAAELDKVDWAYQYFMKTATIDLTGKGKQYVGTLYIGGTHPAGNGGAWMSAVFGLCGIHCTDHSISIDPHLPAHWQQVEIPLHLHGQALRITLDHRQARIQALTPLTQPLTVIHAGDAYSLPISGELTIPLR